MPKKKTPTCAAASLTVSVESKRRPIRNNVRNLRQERKWTQWQLAQVSRLSQRTIQRIEHGDRIGITAELALATAFEVDASELYSAAPPGNRGGAPAARPQRLQLLKRIVTGATLLEVIEAGRFRFELIENQAVEECFQHIGAWTALWREIDPGARGKAHQVFQTNLDELEAVGVLVFGAPPSEPRPDGTMRNAGWLVFKRADDPQIVQPKLLRQFGKSMCFITVPTHKYSRRIRVEAAKPGKPTTEGDNR